MYNNPYEYYRPQPFNTMNMNQMDNPQDMGSPQQPLYNQMPTMPMQPIMPIDSPAGSMGTTSGMMGDTVVPGTTSGPQPTNIASIPLPGGAEEPPIMDIEYTQGWLRTQIGQRVKIEFLIGTNMLIDREGTLVDVGISYVIINEVDTDDLLLCDIYSIKFVKVYL
jgi:hypothetical protein